MDTFLDAIDGSFCTYSAFGQTGNNNTIDPGSLCQATLLLSTMF